MKDFLGNELNVGDNVVCIVSGYRGFTKAKILSISAKRIRVIYPSLWKLCNDKVVTLDPVYNVIKIV